jgi:hypothetical protein
VRLGALLALELKTEWRYGIPVVLFGLSIVWAVLVTVVGPDAAPYVLFVETLTVGVTAVGALTATAAGTGATAALRVTPVRPAEHVAARLAPLTLLTVACGVPVLVAGGAGARLPSALFALGLAALVLLAIALAVAARRRSFVGFLTAAPWPMVPLLAIPLAVALGLVGGPMWYAVPTTGALALLRGDPAYPGWLLIAYLGAWAVAAAWLAARAVAAPEPVAARGGGGRPLRGRFAFARADLRNVSRDSMLVLLVASPLVLGLALRFGYPPLAGWVSGAYAVDLAPYRPILAIIAVLLHVPVTTGMTAALISLDDLDTGTIDVIGVSPLGVRRFLAYRMLATAGAATLGLAAAAPLSGLVPRSAWVSALLAVPLAPLLALAMLATAGNRVQGVTAGKALGLPGYGPIAVWWLGGAAAWWFAALPGFWVIRAWGDPSPRWLAGGVVCCAGWLLLLWRRVVRRLS